MSRTALPLAAWPSADQAAWAEAQRPADPFDDPPAGRPLSLASWRIAQKGYGQWLGFLARQGWLDATQSPLDRVTRPRLRAWLIEIQARGNAPATIATLFNGLQRALQRMAPGQDIGCVLRPFSRRMRNQSPDCRRTVPVPDAAVLFAWAMRMIAEADDQPTPQRRFLDLRDGLILAMLAARARRLRAMEGLRIGRELLDRGEHFRIELGAELVKTGKFDAFDLPAALTAPLRRYITHARPAMLVDPSDPWLWISTRGTRLSAKGLAEQVFKRTRARFGQGIRPHRFRHALATSAALHDPATPGLAPALLGISAAIVDRHYNRASQVQAAQTYAAIMAQQRDATARRSNAGVRVKQKPIGIEDSRCTTM